MFKDSRIISAKNELITTPEMFTSGIFIRMKDKIIFTAVANVSLKKGRTIFPDAYKDAEIMPDTGRITIIGDIARRMCDEAVFLKRIYNMSSGNQ